MKLTNEETSRVYSQYWGNAYRYVPVGNLSKEYSIAHVDGKTLTYISRGVHKGNPFLLLTPLSSITDEHAIEFYSLNAAYPTNDLDDIIKIGTVKEWLIANESPICWDAYQYLISKGYAVPLWFGLGHWANSKTAIELGIAIDKTTQL